MVCFQPLKHYHSEIIDQAVRSGDTQFTRAEFLAAFDRIRMQAFKPDTIKSAFRKTGLFPFNPNEVMHTLYEEKEEEILPSYFDMNTTPKKILELEAYAEELYLMVEDRSSPLVDAVTTFARGAMA